MLSKTDLGRHLYIAQEKATGNLKIGRSGNPEERLRSLQTGCPNTLKLILVFPENGRQEKATHKKLSKFRIRKSDPEHEFFSEEAIGSLPEDIQENFESWWREDPDWWKRR